MNNGGDSMPRATAKTIASACGIHPNTVRNWSDENLIDCVRDFRGTRWFPDEEGTIRKVKELLGLASTEEEKANPKKGAN